MTDDEDSNKKDIKKPQKQSSTRPDSQPYPNAGSPVAGPSIRPTPPLSRGSSVDRERDASVGPDGSKSILRIKRLVSFLSIIGTKRGALKLVKVDGLWQTEIIRDPAVIRAYVRGRQALEEEATLADSLAPTGDADKDKRAKKRYFHYYITREGGGLTLFLSFFFTRLEEEIARMKKNQERRLHRKNAKIVKEGGTPMQLNRPVKPDTTVYTILDSFFFFFFFFFPR